MLLELEEADIRSQLKSESHPTIEEVGDTGLELMTMFFSFALQSEEGMAETLKSQAHVMRLEHKLALIEEEFSERYSIILEDIISGKRKIMDKPDDYLKELKFGRDFSTTPSLAVSVSSYKQLYMARYGGGRQDESTFDPRFTFDQKVQMSELELITRIR